MESDKGFAELNRRWDKYNREMQTLIDARTVHQDELIQTQPIVADVAKPQQNLLRFRRRDYGMLELAVLHLRLGFNHLFAGRLA